MRKKVKIIACYKKFFERKNDKIQINFEIFAKLC